VKTYVKYHYRFSKADRKHKFPKPPFMVVANHGTFFDPWFIGGYSHYPLSYMINNDVFRGKDMSAWYLRSIDSIPKKKGASDFKAMKATIERLNNKRAVCIFPEGQTTWDGETQLLYRGIEKIIKKVNCPLVMVRLQGNFLTKPWWADSLREGRILLHFKTLEKKDIEQLSFDELFNTIKSYIYQNDIKDPQNLAVPFTGVKLAEGLERFVWICMHCGSEDTLVTSDNTIRCTSCKGSWDIDAHCRLSSNDPSFSCLPDLKDWSDMHKEKVQEFISNRENELTRSSDVTLQKENSEQMFENKESGTLILFRERLLFETASTTLQWPVKEITDYVIQKKDIFEFSHNSEYYRFVFNKKSPMKWIYYFRYLNNYSICEKQGYY
jgi:hypothetical protein